MNITALQFFYLPLYCSILFTEFLVKKVLLILTLCIIVSAVGLAEATKFSTYGLTFGFSEEKSEYQVTSMRSTYFGEKKSSGFLFKTDLGVRGNNLKEVFTSQGKAADFEFKYNLSLALTFPSFMTKNESKKGIASYSFSAIGLTAGNKSGEDLFSLDLGATIIIQSARFHKDGIFTGLLLQFYHNFYNYSDGQLSPIDNSGCKISIIFGQI